MQTKLNRRQWFKSSFAITAGLTLAPSISQHLMAAPVSNAEKLFENLNNNEFRIFLDSNENPYGPSDKAKAAIIQHLSAVNRYPVGATDDLKMQIAKKEGVPVEYIHIGAGSGDILCQTGAVFGLGGGRVISAFPTFSLLMNYAELFNATWDKVNVNEKLEHDYDAMAAAIRPDTKLIFICNPNNPTGTLVDFKKVKSFCEEVSKKVPVYSDEAYLEFLEPAQQVSMVELVKKDLNVIVSRTFSKIHGLAGMRIGYIVAKPDLIKKISAFEHDIPVSASAIAAAQAVLGDEEFMAMTRAKNAIARNVLTQYLDKNKISYGNPNANFVFFPTPKDGKTILQKMSEKKFSMRIWDYKGSEWCRVSIGTEEQMKKFVVAFDQV